MDTYTVYRLIFKTQLHLGRATGPAQTGSLGLQNTEIYIPADTLFSAICQMWATFYDAASLTAFLSKYTADSTAPPFMLTSVFPFAHDVYLFPKPLTWTDRSKESKRVRFVSHNVFQDIISGTPPIFKKNNLINGENVWGSPNEIDQLKKAMDDEPVVWKTATRPRVTIGSQNAGSEIWHVQTVQFNKCCGLWFAADFDSDETQQKIETLFRVLGDCGIGGERNAGYGQFDIVEVDNLEIPTADAGNQFVTLSPMCPKSQEQLEHLLKGDIAYTLTQSTGWLSATGSAKRRNQVNMFSEGSVLNISEEQVGRLVDLKPDTWSHPVYRYGYAWQVRLKGAENETEIST